MLKHAIVLGVLCTLVAAEAPVQTVKPTSVLGSSEPHTSFSFIRPGLTQTSFAFGGPSSHQSFSSTVGNPQLAQKVLPSLAQVLAYRNPSLGYYPVASAGNGYGIAQAFATAPATGPLTYQATVDPATALAYAQQLQSQQQQAYLHGYQPNAAYQAQLTQLLALRQAQAQQAQQEQLQAIGSQQVSEQDDQLQQQKLQAERPSPNLLGVAYSSAPSVAHVKVSGSGYKFDF